MGPQSGAISENSSGGSLLRRKHAIDVRHFLVAAFGVVAASFIVGISLGPVRSIPQTSSSPSHADSIPAIDRTSGWTEMRPSPTPKHAEQRGDAETLGNASHRRASTLHLGDMGKLLDGAAGREYHPAGQHLLVDIQGVSGAFLDSEERLAGAMVETILESELSLLSYHCHKLFPKGVSCVGVLLESHISFHTWPDEGVITLDLFTCGGKPLLPAMPIIERLFGVPRSVEEGPGVMFVEGPSKDGVLTKWAHQLRGFRGKEERAKHMLDDQKDLARWVTTKLDYDSKIEVVSVQTPYHQIDVWDNSDVHNGLATRQEMIDGPFPFGDERYLTFNGGPGERLLFVDGIVRLMNETAKTYYEALVHPAMFAHTNPKKVAIVSGGSCGALKEVLMHESVEIVDVIEPDSQLVEISLQYFESICDCSATGAQVCFDDQRANLRYVTPEAFFEKNIDEYDVIIIDDHSFLSEKDSPLPSALVKHILSSLNDEGVITLEAGYVPNVKSPPDHREHRRREELLRLLGENTSAVMVYDEGRVITEFEPRSFLVACNNSDACRRRWYANADEVDQEVKRRFGNAAKDVTYYDGGTQHQYKSASRAWEEIYCHRDPMPEECNYRGLNMENNIVSFEEGFEVRKGSGDAYGIFATNYIVEASYLMAEELAATTLFLSGGLHEEMSTKNSMKSLFDLFNKHGRTEVNMGGVVVDAGLATLIRQSSTKEKANVVRLSYFLPHRPSYSPVFDRYRQTYDVVIVALRDITKGEELVLFCP
mmetsp:Transcript_6823/g.14717  ORF Transcript_6823/g.14717 Transcript_6823/m.14717 type:complete len:765 (-) Transcript_6823:277-2571(-)